jgi:hypothetical protein
MADPENSAGQRRTVSTASGHIPAAGINMLAAINTNPGFFLCPAFYTGKKTPWIFSGKN